MSESALSLQAAEHAAVAERAGYALQAPLWRDGLSVCYRASHRRLDRTVVFKTADVRGPGGRTRLELLAWEARVLARLDHPGVVRLYDYGVLDEQPFLLLEYPTRGRLLAEVHTEPRPALARAVGLIAALARTVHALHQQGFVHRNLKPASVWLMADGSFRLADLAIAVALRDGVSPVRVAGTRAYMAPEQAAGLEEVGPAADVYSLGVMLYELLTGVVPFAGGWQQGRQAEPLPRLRADVPGWLDGVCRRCLDPEQRRRFPTAETLARTLEQGLPASDQPAFPYELLRRFIAGELSAAERAAVERNLTTDPRWRAHQESARHWKLERIAAEQDARELAAFADEKATAVCREVARTNGDALLPLLRPGPAPAGELLRHVQGCVFCRRMNRLVQARVLAEAQRLPAGEKLFREWLLEPIYGPVLEQVRERLRGGSGARADGVTVVERPPGEEETVILQPGPARGR